MNTEKNNKDDQKNDIKWLDEAIKECFHPEGKTSLAWQRIKDFVEVQNKQSAAPLCSACGVELSCRNRCHDTNSPHGIVMI